MQIQNCQNSEAKVRIMAGAKFGVALALLFAVALKDLLPTTRGHDSANAIAELQSQMQDVIRRLERLENGRKTRSVGTDEAASGWIFPPIQGPKGERGLPGLPGPPVSVSSLYCSWLLFNNVRALETTFLIWIKQGTNRTSRTQG